MIADLGDDELPHIPSGIINQSRSASSRMTDHEGTRAEEGTKLATMFIYIAEDVNSKSHLLNTVNLLLFLKC